MARLGHTVAMSNEAGEPDGLPVGPLPGAVRFAADGRMEIYRDGGWQPLVELSDASLPPLFRDIGQAAEGAHAAEDSDGGDPSPQAPA
jgi:hypothetical protein